jgi:hypothetical protein
LHVHSFAGVFTIPLRAGFPVQHMADEAAWRAKQWKPAARPTPPPPPAVGNMDLKHGTSHSLPAAAARVHAAPRVLARSHTLAGSTGAVASAPAAMQSGSVRVAAAVTAPPVTTLDVRFKRGSGILPDKYATAAYWPQLAQDLRKRLQWCDVKDATVTVHVYPTADVTGMLEKRTPIYVPRDKQCATGPCTALAVNTDTDVALFYVWDVDHRKLCLWNARATRVLKMHEVRFPIFTADAIKVAKMPVVGNEKDEELYAERLLDLIAHPKEYGVYYRLYACSSDVSLVEASLASCKRGDDDSSDED